MFCLFFVEMEWFASKCVIYTPRKWSDSRQNVLFVLCKNEVIHVQMFLILLQNEVNHVKMFYLYSSKMKGLTSKCLFILHENEVDHVSMFCLYSSVKMFCLYSAKLKWFTSKCFDYTSFVWNVSVLKKEMKQVLVSLKALMRSKIKSQDKRESQKSRKSTAQKWKVSKKDKSVVRSLTWHEYV